MFACVNNILANYPVNSLRYDAEVETIHAHVELTVEHEDVLQSLIDELCIMKTHNTQLPMIVIECSLTVVSIDVQGDEVVIEKATQDENIVYKIKYL